MGDKLNFEGEIAKYFEEHGIEFDQKWPFPTSYFEKLLKFLGIDGSGVGNDHTNKYGEIERPVFYAARVSIHPHMACIKPENDKISKYRDVDDISNVQNIAKSKQLWYCAVDQLQLPKGAKINQDYLVKIACRLFMRVSNEKEVRPNSIGLLLDGDFDREGVEKIVEQLKKEDKGFEAENVCEGNDFDRRVRIVNSADSCAYGLRDHYIKTGELLRPDCRVFVGGDLNVG